MQWKPKNCWVHCAAAAQSLELSRVLIPVIAGFCPLILWTQACFQTYRPPRKDVTQNMMYFPVDIWRNKREGCYRRSSKPELTDRFLHILSKLQIHKPQQSYVTLRDWNAFSGFRYACDFRIATAADIMIQWPKNALLCWPLQCQQRTGMHHLLSAQPEHIACLPKLHSTCLFLSKGDIVHNFKDWWEGGITHTVKSLTAEELLRLSSALQP